MTIILWDKINLIRVCYTDEYRDVSYIKVCCLYYSITRIIKDLNILSEWIFSYTENMVAHVQIDALGQLGSAIMQ